MPWWYFYKANTGTKLDDQIVETVDQGGKIWETLGPERAIGCVVYPACQILEPGVIKHNGNGERFSLGEPDGSRSGNAVDASIAASIVLSVVEPNATSIGGDCFAIVKMEGKESVSYNGSGIAPGELDYDFFNKNNLDKVGLTSH